MSKVIEIVSNAIKCKVLNPELDVKVALTEILSYYVKGYENMTSYKLGKWDGKSTMYDWRTDTFPNGFAATVNACLTKLGYQVRNLRKPLPMPLGRLPEHMGKFSYTDRYDYQWTGIKELEHRGMMISRLATGAGKTFQAALAIARINRPTLILTKRQPLMYQFQERLREFGYDPGMIGDNRFSIKKELTVGMAQSLNAKMDDPEIQEFLQQVEFIIGEEAHEISDEAYWNVIQACPNAYYKLALTATPFMKDKSESNMKLLAAFGPVGLNVSEKTLIDRGINAKPIIKFADYEGSNRLRFGSNYQKAMFEGVTHCYNRNMVIIDNVKKAVKRKMPVLILVQRQDHGKLLRQYLLNEKIRTEFIFGDSTTRERRRALMDLEDGTTQVLIGSSIVDVGVDVPCISLLINAGAGKAEAQYRQRIGRGLRSKSKGPNVCFFLDFNDDHHRILHEHSQERLKIIKETPGFSENLLPPGDDFDWSLFDKVKSR